MKKDILNKIYLRVNRNKLDQEGKSLKKNKVNLIYWKKQVNLGDTLAPVILDWMLKRKGIEANQSAEKTYALATVGSIVDLGRFDATIWGSGLQSFESLINISKAHYKKLDIRAVRGPYTRQALLDCGYRCPEIYGDPGILMPDIYMPENIVKKDKVALVNHYSIREPDAKKHNENVEILNIKTADYKGFIDSLCCAKKVVSSSLHGIILAESYGIPAVFLLADPKNKEILKYYDWYFSTNRFSVKIALSLEEALFIEPMQLPDNLEIMKKQLIQAFPYDLWGKN